MEQCLLPKAVCRATLFKDVNLDCADFSHADLSGADFGNANLNRCKLHRITEENTRWDKGAKSVALGTDPEQAEAEDWGK